MAPLSELASATQMSFLKLERLQRQKSNRLVTAAASPVAKPAGGPRKQNSAAASYRALRLETEREERLPLPTTSVLRREDFKMTIRQEESFTANPQHHR